MNFEILTIDEIAFLRLLNEREPRKWWQWANLVNFNNDQISVVEDLAAKNCIRYLPVMGLVKMKHRGLELLEIAEASLVKT
jgi:hypothetical protein